MLFSQLIQNSYGPLTQSARLVYGDCLVDESTSVATLDVRFDQWGEVVFALRYVLTEDADGWRVDGASSIELIGSET